jgi:hypothetical protein
LATLALTGELVKTRTARRQFGLFHDEDWETVFDFELKATALAKEMIVPQAQPRSTGVHRTAEDVQQFLIDHGRQLRLPQRGSPV